MNLQHWLICLMLCYLGVAIGNPGVLITVPFPQSPPMVQLPLPISIENIVINNLQLTKILLNSLQYTWKFNSANAEIQIPKVIIYFDWFYKNDKGKGSFTEDKLKLDIYYSFMASEKNHFQINITSTKIHPGHSSVALGGGAPEIVIVQVTSLILNHASILFRSFIANKLSQTITEFSSKIGDDRVIYHDSTSKTDFYINASLVVNPLISNNTLVIQLDGGPYIKGGLIRPLNPPDILIRSNSSKIQVQIHKLLASSFLNLFIQARGGDITVQLHSLSITSVIDVNSLLLSPIFPPMAFFPDQRDVIFQIKIPAIDFDFDENNLKLQMQTYFPVITHNTIERRDELYIERINAALKVELLPILFRNKCSIRIEQMKVLNFIPLQGDVAKGLIVPQALNKYFDFLTGWLADGINLELNRQVFTLAYKNIQIALKGSVVKNAAYSLQIDFMQ